MHPSGDPIRLLAQPMEREFEDMMCWWPHPSTNLLLEARSGVSVPFRVMSMPIQRRLSRSATADRGTAATERVEHQIALVAARQDDTFQRGTRHQGRETALRNGFPG